MESLSRQELFRLVERVFRPRAEDRALALLVDLPDERTADHPAWAARREMARDWWRILSEGRAELGLEAVDLVSYPNVGSNNADLPADPFDSVFSRYSILIAVTEFSATAPLKLKAREHGFRAATMPGFTTEMIPALRVDFTEVGRRCDELKARLDEATAAHFEFEAGGKCQDLTLDLRHRRGTASGGLLHEPGTAGNLPPGETYIVPYEGEREGDPSRSRGLLPLELRGELLFYRIEENRVVEVIGEGPLAESERRQVAAEPAYANVAELGLGLLADYGVKPVGQLLLDEKLGLHIAFGRSDHFGGQVGAKNFSSPEKVVHIDRVFIPEVQPGVRVRAVDLESAAGRTPLMRGGRYVAGG